MTVSSGWLVLALAVSLAVLVAWIITGAIWDTIRAVRDHRADRRDARDVKRGPM